MRAQRSGTIVNITSMGGKIYTPLGAWYHATKFALEALSDCLRLEVKPFGINVVVIEPGGIQTEWPAIAAEQAAREPPAGGPYAKQANAVAASLDLRSHRRERSVTAHAHRRHHRQSRHRTAPQDPLRHRVRRQAHDLPAHRPARPRVRCLHPPGHRRAVMTTGEQDPGLRITDALQACPPDVPEPPSTANDRHQQQSVNLKLAQGLNPRATHENTLVMRKSPPSASSGSCTRRALPCSEPRSPRGRHGHSVFPAQA